MPPRYFTVEQANRLLPELIPVLEELRALKRQLDALRAEQSLLQAKARGNGHNQAAEIADLAGRIERLVNESSERIAQITALGVEIKDIELGLVDFLSLHQGRRVYLCWKLGEPSVRYWHTLEGGYAGRQPIPGLEEP
ncbi:MAG: DUF2203 domain-containing protein [Chloroflexi bacterium]|nr:DUF2203 domain-containing protein [Chloroflexota bacterium]GIW11788.1 MAG: hypothetical protein KatS3mg061_2845 [Dehalococcoidia bacterium]